MAKKIDSHNISELITTINSETLDTFFENILSNDIQASIDTIFDIVNSGISVIDILFELISYIKNSYCVIKDDSLKYKIIQIITKYITIFNNSHEDQIEIAFLTNDLLSIIEIEKENNAKYIKKTSYLHEFAIYDINT